MPDFIGLAVIALVVGVLAAIDVLIRPLSDGLAKLCLLGAIAFASRCEYHRHGGKAL